MGQQSSKDELVYQLVSHGITEGIKALQRKGASLEWTDAGRKTPLILACLDPKLYEVAKTLIELGANVNAYRAGYKGGTPLHHAANKGLEKTVMLLLSHGANPLAKNDDSQTPIEVARANGHHKVVRAIESHICLFSGWMREFYGPRFLEVLAPRLFSGKVWVVVLPTETQGPEEHFNLEIAIYYSSQHAKPHTTIALWQATMQEPRFHQSDPSVTIADNNTNTHIKIGPTLEGDNEQFQWFCDACKGIPKIQPPVVQGIAPPHAEGFGNIPADQTATQAPSAPPITDDLVKDGLIHHPSIDSTPIDMPSPPAENLPASTNNKKEDGGCSSCVMCLDAPVEGACVPCGHMAGCMSCLNEIRAKEGRCPVCRAKMDQVIRLYSV